MSQKWMCVNMGMFVNPDNLAFQAALNARIYVDKSGILNYTNSVLGSTDAFICNSRPRRFGKSLLISTFESLFRHGLRDFKGLAIEKLWIEESKPLVVRLDFSEIKNFSSPEDFSRKFTSLISRCFGMVGFQYVDDDLNSASGQLSTSVSYTHLTLPTT